MKTGLRGPFFCIGDMPVCADSSASERLSLNRKDRINYDSLTKNLAALHEWWQRASHGNVLIFVVGPAGLEPATKGL